VEKLKNYVRTACVNMAKSRWRALQADKRGGGKVDTRAGMHDLDKVEIKYGQAEVELDDSQASSSLLGNMNTSEFEWKVFDKISPHDQTQQTDLRNLLLVFMEEMDEDDRQLIRLGFWDELPHKEIAKKMGVSEKSVGSRLNRAVEKLTRKLGTIVKNELK
jgi:RNA polymerase sigma factor (sigma-70 family)